MPIQQVGVPPGMRYAWVTDDSQESGVGIALVPDNGSPAPGEVPPPPGRPSANEQMAQQAASSAMIQQNQVQVRQQAEAQAKAAGLNPAALDAADPSWWKWQNPVARAVGYNGGDMTARNRNEEMAAAQLRNELQNTPGAKATRLPNGSIFDPKSGATYTDPRMVPPDILKEANVALTPVQQQEADNNRKAPAMKDGVQTRVEGNPTPVERKQGINSTQPAGNPPFPAPSPNAAVFPAPAPAPAARRQGGIRSIQPVVLTPEQRASMDPTTLNLVLSGQMAPPAAGAGAVPQPQFRRGTMQAQGQQAPFPAPTGGGSTGGTKFRVMSAGGRGSLTQQPPAPLDPGDAGNGDIPPDPGGGAYWDPDTKQWITPPVGAGTGTAPAASATTTKPRGGQQGVPVYAEDGTLIGHNVTLGVGSIDPDNGEVLRAPKTQFIRADRPRDAAAQGQDVASAGHLAAQAAATTQLLPYQIDQIVANMGLTNQQAARVKALLPGEMLIQGATVAQLQASIENARGQLGLARDQFDFNKGIAAAGLTGSYNGNPTLAAQELGLKADTEYAASRRADLLANLQRADRTGIYEGSPTMDALKQGATITGYDQYGNPTFEREKVGAEQDLANFKAQSDAAYNAGLIALKQGDAVQAAKEFERKQALDEEIKRGDLALGVNKEGFNQQLEAAKFEMQRRADPSSFLDKAYAMRGLAAPDVTPNTPYPGTTEGGPQAMIPQQQYQQAPFAAPVPPSRPETQRYQPYGGLEDAQASAVAPLPAPSAGAPAPLGEGAPTGVLPPDYAAAGKADPFQRGGYGARFYQQEGQSGNQNQNRIGQLPPNFTPPAPTGPDGVYQNYGGAAPQYGVAQAAGQYTPPTGLPPAQTSVDALNLQRQAQAMMQAIANGDTTHTSLDVLRLQRQAQNILQGIANPGAPPAPLPAPLAAPTPAPAPTSGVPSGEGLATGALPAGYQPQGKTDPFQRGGYGLRTLQTPGTGPETQRYQRTAPAAPFPAPRLGLAQYNGNPNPQAQQSAAPFPAPSATPARGGALSYDELTRSKALPPGIGNVFAGQNAGSFNTAGGVPLVSAQKYGSLSPLERQGFDATLKASGNDPASYLDQVEKLSQTGSAPGQFQRRSAAPQRAFAGY